MITFNAKTNKALFQLEMPEAHSVSLLGDFNQWDETKNVMKKDKSGFWKTEIKLLPGEYQFLYYIDKNRWMRDDHCPRATSDVGTENSIAVIKGEKAAKAPVKKPRPAKKK